MTNSQRKDEACRMKENNSNTDQGIKMVQKKLIKRNMLFDAAFDLFMTKGEHETVIDDIVKKAGVAKGTFYLYFKDKHDLLNHIVCQKSYLVTKEALEYVRSAEGYDNMGAVDRVIMFIDYIIEHLKENKKLLKLIYKNLSWGLYRRALSSPDEFQELKSSFDMVLKDLNLENTSKDSIEKTLYIIIELVSSVCYSTIILEDPYKIDEIKPELHRIIRRILTEMT